MQYYVEMLNSTYEMNSRESRLALRQDLFKVGFFDYKENEIYWKLLEEKGADLKQAKDFNDAVYLFNEIKLRPGTPN